MSRLNLDIFKVWGDKERTEFVEYCQELLLEYQTKSLVFGDKRNGLNFWLYEISHRSMLGEIPTETVVSAFSEIISLHGDLPSLIADILVLLDTESQNCESHTLRERYFNLLRYCNNKIVPEFILKERLEFETLGDAGIMKLLKNTQTKFIKTKTRLFYKQQKFNLYREEIEGYAKLITELDPDSGNELNVQYILEVMQSLIGCFNLDPNRVLDVILESFEHKPSLSDFFSQLILSYFSTSETVSQVIGFKFSFYQQGDKETPLSLYRVTAFLLKSGVMSLNQLYGLLQPDDNKIIEEHKQELANAQVYVKQLNSLSTSAVENNKEACKNEDKMGFDDNQKLGLCAALLDVGDWKHARQLINCFPDYYATSHPHIAKKLCQLMHVIIDDFYKKFNPCPEIKCSTKWKLDSGIKCKSIETFSELFSDVFAMVLALGPHLHIDPILMAKIIRLSRHWMLLKSNIPDYGIAAISNAIEQCLLPSLSLLDCNCCMAEELWSLLKSFPYQARYTFYYQWKSTMNSMHPLLIKVKADTLKKLKYIMKRLSKENVKPSGRQIGKLSHSNPGYIFDYILSQIQAWDNLIIPVIDSLKYLTQLSYDVLAFCIIEALGNSEKDRMKHDGTSISLWFQSLASFGGSVFKKYPIDISGLLQHVANQLISGKSLDLLILKEVVQKMAGIEASEELTPDQLDAMTGGELLRSEGGYFNQLRNVKKSSQRLKDALLDQDLAIPLCLLMAQQRQCILFHEQENSHIKLVGKLYDQCQDTLVQYGSFLSNSLSMEDYAKRLPLVSTLLSDYNIQADVAFYLARPSLNHAINSKFEELRKQDKSLKNTTPESTQKYIEVVESVIEPIVTSIKANPLLKKTWDDLNPGVYVTFWSLSMYDLVVPTESYQREVNKLKAIVQSEENKDAGKKKKERERCDALISKLQEEEKQQQEHCSRIMTRLKNEKDGWFKTNAPKNETITQFLQLCLFPRCTFTPVDALYCAKFVNLIHNLRTPHFSTLLCYDRVFLDIANAVASCTENEANRYGLLLCKMLETVSRWHSDKAIFDKECAFYPGFVTKFKVATMTSSDSAVDHVDYENFRHVCHKWHFKITKSLLQCLDSGDYVQIRNSLLVLRKVAPHFPAMVHLSSALERRMEKIKTEEKDKRPDIYVLATGYSGVLKTRKPFLVQESEFHLKESRRVANAARTSEKRDHENVQPEASKEKNAKFDSKIEAGRIKSSSVDKVNVVPSNLPLNNKRTVRIEGEQNGVENIRTKVVRPKEEKSTSENASPMRREDKSVIKADPDKVVNSKDDKRDRREERHEKPGISSGDREGSDSNRESHSYRRSLDVADAEREHKRRRTEGSSSSRSPRDPIDRDTRGVSEKLKDDERNGREKSVGDGKSHKDVDLAAEKAKAKEKKANRKREYPEESLAEPRRRRPKSEKDDDDSSKRSVDGEREPKSRRDEKSPVVYASNSDRRVERDEKKHHRSTSASSVKKRS